MRTAIGLVPIFVIVLAGCDFSLGGPRDPCSESPQIGQLRLVIEPQREPPFDFEFLAPNDTARLSAWLARINSGVTDQGDCTFFYDNPIPTVFEWRSADAAIATVDADGTVVARAPGITLVTVRAPAYSLERSRKVEVQLRP